jgi:cohesin domain-containing protein
MPHGALVSDRNGNPDIYTIRSDGSELTQRTTYSGVDVNPVWDSSNFMLLISSDRESGMEIYSLIFGSNKLNRLSVDSGDSIEPHIGVGSGQSGKVLAAKTRNRPYSNQVQVDVAEAQASINQGEGEPGEVVSLEIKLEGVKNLGNLAFDVLFDRSQLILAEMPQGDLLLDSLFALNPEIVPDETGMVQFNWVKSAGFSGDSQIMTLELEIKRLAGLEEVEVSLRDLQAYDLNLNEIPIKGLDGLVTITGNSTDVQAWMLFE